jgi:hypothetical protein
VINPKNNSNISRYGYHGLNDPILKRRSGQIIIAVAGGSFARDFVTGPGDETLIELLQQSPEYAGKKIICLNLAISGYKQPQQLMTINYLLALGGEFDMVINIDGFNEVALHGPENQRKGIAPAYPRIWNQRIDPLADPVIQRLATQRILVEQQRVQISAAFSGRPWRYSVICQLIWQLMDTSLEQKSFRASKAYMDYKPTGDSRYVVTGPGELFGEDDAARYRYLVDLWQRGSLQLDHLCKANGIRYYHFLQPNQYVTGSKTLNQQERDTAYNSDTPYLAGVTKGYPLLLKAGRRLSDAGVSFTDLTQIYVSRSDTIYNDTCCHVNDNGNRLLAKRIALIIINSDANKPSP